MTINTQSKILKGREEAPSKPADAPILSQDKKGFQITESTWRSVGTRLLYVALSATISPAWPKRITSENTVILAGGFENGEEVKRVSKSGMDCLTDLYSDQKEADTRLTVTCNTACTVTFSSHCEMWWYRCTGFYLSIFKQRDVWILSSVPALWTWPKGNLSVRLLRN